MSTPYSAIVVGTGFASSFFLKRFLEKAPNNARVLVLERGQRNSHQWQVENRRNSPIKHASTYINSGTLHQGNAKKNWIFTIGFGGGSNCWWACTPRFLPNDFRMQALYGVSRDWPLSYDELEPYYQQAEEIMAIAGPSQHTPFPRSKPYPLPAHEPSTVDQILQRHYPESYFIQPTARASRPTDRRPKCCGNGVCNICPISAKFAIAQEFNEVFADPRVEVRMNAQVERLDIANNLVTGVYYRNINLDSNKASSNEQDAVLVKGDLVALGANAFFNPAILLRSGVEQSALGRFVNEQEAVYIEVDLDGVDNFDGGTSITGHGYQFYDGDHRKQHAACLLESYNLLGALRTEQGKWRQRVVFKAIFEELPQADNRVQLSSDQPNKPEVVYKGPSEYVSRAITALKTNFEQWISVLPVEAIRYRNNPLHTEAHILGSTVMGNDPTNSVVDKNLVHHQLRNLLVMGSSVFPTCSPANPSLTISALSLHAADQLFS